MTQQALNSIMFYRGASPSTIAQLLQMQRTSVVEELKAHYGCEDIHALANRLSKGV